MSCVRAVRWATLASPVCRAPRIQASIRDSLAKPVTLTLSGPGGGTWILDPDDKLITVIAAGPDVPTAAVVQSSSHEFTA